MYKAMQKIQSRLIGLVQRDNAEHINAERENAEFRKVLADGGGEHYVLYVKAQEIFDKMEANLTNCEKKNAKSKEEQDYWKGQAERLTEIAEQRSVQILKQQYDRQIKSHNLRTIIKERDNELKSGRNQTRSLEEVLKKEKKDHDVETASLRAQVVDCKKTIKLAQQGSDKLSMEKTQLEKLHDQQIAQMSRGHDRAIDDLNREKNHLKDQLDRSDKSLKDSQKDKEGLRASASSKVDNESIRKEIERKDSKIKSLEEELSQLKTDYDTRARNIDSLERKMKDQADDLEQVEVQRQIIREKGEEIGTMRERERDSSYKAEVLQAEIKICQEKLQAKAISMDDNERAQKELQHRINELEEQVEQLNLTSLDMDDLRAKEENLQMSLEDLSSNLQSKSHELVTSHNKIDKLQEMVEKLEKKIANQLHDIQEFTKVNDYYQAKSEECEAEKASLVDNMTNLTKKLSGCEAEREELRKEVQGLLERNGANFLAAEAAETAEQARKDEVKGLKTELKRVKAQHEKTLKTTQQLLAERQRAREGMLALQNENALVARNIDRLRKYENCEAEKVTLIKETQALKKHIDDVLMKDIEDRNEYIRELEGDRVKKETNFDYLLKDATKMDHKLEDRDKEITKLGKELQQAKENLRRCQEDCLDNRQKLKACEEDRKRKEAEIDALKDGLRRAAPDGSKGGISSGEHKGPAYTPRGSSRQLEQELSAALSDDEGKKKPTSEPTPPSGGSKQPKTPKRLRTSPAQIVTRAKSPDTGGSNVTGVTDESVASSSPVEYVGPPPVPASIDLAILRTKLALRQMRSERAQHGFHHGDSLVVRNAARDVLHASELLPGGTDEENAIRDRYLARAACYMGVSYYYRDEARRAHGWFTDVGKRDADVYTPGLIEKWLERCQETQGPPKEASYYRDPSYGGKGERNEKEKKPEEGKKPSRRGSDKPPKLDPKKDDDDDGNDGYGSGEAGIGSYLTPGFMMTSPQNRRRAASVKKDDSKRPKTETEESTTAEQAAQDIKGGFSSFFSGLWRSSSSTKAKKTVQFEASVIEGLKSPSSIDQEIKVLLGKEAEVEKLHEKIKSKTPIKQRNILIEEVAEREQKTRGYQDVDLKEPQTQVQCPDPSTQEQAKTEVPSQDSGSTLSSMRAEIEELKSSPPSSTTARKTDIKPLAQRLAQLIQPETPKSEAKPHTEESSITEPVTQEIKNSFKGFIPGYFTRSGSTKNAPPEKEVSFESMTSDEIAAYNFEAEAKILAEAEAKGQTKDTQSHPAEKDISEMGVEELERLSIEETGKGKVRRAVPTGHVIERPSDDEQSKSGVEPAKTFPTVSDVELGPLSIKHLSKAEGKQTAKQVPNEPGPEVPRVVDVEEFERWDIRKAKGKAKAAASRSSDVPGPEVPRVTSRHLLKPEKAVEEPSNQGATKETGEARRSDLPFPTTGESSPRRMPLPISPKGTFAEVMVKPVKAKEEGEATEVQPLISEDESSPRKIPLSDGSKDAAGMSTTKAVEKAKESDCLGRSMQARKASGEEKKEKPLSRLEAAEVAERVGKEEWFKKSRETKEKRQEGGESKGERALGHTVDDIPPT